MGFACDAAQRTLLLVEKLLVAVSTLRFGSASLATARTSSSGSTVSLPIICVTIYRLLNLLLKCLQDNTHCFTHTGAQVSFTNWERDPPSTSSRVCVRIGGAGPYKSLWKPGPCLDQGGFVCERLRGDLTAPPPAPSTTPDPFGCPAGTLDVGHHCIFVCIFYFFAS